MRYKRRYSTDFNYIFKFFWIFSPIFQWRKKLAFKFAQKPLRTCFFKSVFSRSELFLIQFAMYKELWLVKVRFQCSIAFYFLSDAKSYSACNFNKRLHRFRQSRKLNEPKRKVWKSNWQLLASRKKRIKCYFWGELFGAAFKE